MLSCTAVESAAITTLWNVIKLSIEPWGHTYTDILWWDSGTDLWTWALKDSQNDYQLNNNNWSYVRHSCNMNVCEDVMHFLMISPKYIEEKQLLIDPILTDNPNFSDMSIIERFIYLFLLFTFDKCLFAFWKSNGYQI